MGSAKVIGSGTPFWRVTCRNGEDLIRAKGATELGAWRLAVAKARVLGMLGCRRKESARES